MEAPGRPDGPAAVLLLAEAGQSLATLCPGGLLEAASQLVLGGDRLVLRRVALLARVDHVVARLRLVRLDLLAAL